MVQLLSVMKSFQNEGLYLSNIHPNNVLLTEKGEVRVLNSTCLQKFPFITDSIKVLPPSSFFSPEQMDEML